MAETIASLFRDIVAHRKPDAILTKDSGSYAPISSFELERRSIRLHLALRDLGLQRGDKCALISENRWEWAVADFAMMTAGIVSVPIYPTLLADQVRYLLEHSEAKAIFCSTADQMEKILSIRDRLPNLAHVIGFDAAAGEDAPKLADLIGADSPDSDARHRFEEAADTVVPGDLASIIYTSGTTGVPKGVMLSHSNICTNIRDSMLDVQPEDVALSFLPLCHIAERLADYVFFAGGVTVAYAESMEAVAANMGEVKPTMAVGVPRFFEKVHGRVMAAMADAPAIRRKLFHWAVGVGKAATPYRLQDKPLPGLLGIQHGVADKLVFSKLRGRLGGRIRFFVSGAAPLAKHLAEFFYALGLPIREAYGLTETSPLVSINPLEDLRFGTVGKLIPNVEVRIAEDGEILVRGPNIMQGYFKMEEQTAEAMEGGWFHTGDIGNLDADGYLSITDRKKDLFKTSGGKYIAPSPIEGRLKGSPLIELAVVVAEQRNFPSALVVPAFESLRSWAETNGIKAADNEELCANADVQRYVMSEITALCADMAGYEQVKRIALIPNEFSIAGGELTPTMKVRRNEVYKKYSAQIEAIYS
ncbi:MAG: long-chain fatty acid--CoA ligase [Bryobacterales bacterium]|nr:long-chain fatty acid--CoA ligase [Bryobacterales bacterium]